MEVTIRVAGLLLVGASGILLKWFIKVGVGRENAASREFIRIQECQMARCASRYSDRLSTDARMHSYPTAACSAIKHIVLRSRSLFRFVDDEVWKLACFL